MLAAFLLPLLTAGPAAAEEDPMSHDGTSSLISGFEGSKAALVRIEVTATADIVHINHSTGDVELSRGHYEDVPIRTGTGVLISSDGVIAAAGSTVDVTYDDVVVYAANRLFQEVIKVPLTGNGGNLSRRAQNNDDYWGPELQGCYEQAEHCVLFYVPHFQVFSYTSEPTSTPADLLREPTGPTDVGLLRINGAGGTPTAELAQEQTAGEAVLAGFTERPVADHPVTEMHVGLDPETSTLSSDEDLPVMLDRGLAGGPVLEPDTGRVTGLVAWAGRTATLVPVDAVHQALKAAKVSPTTSEFDTIFRVGIAHLASGHASGPALSSFQEALRYYPSALAEHYRGEAEAAGGTDDGADSGSAASDHGGALPGGLGLWVAAAAAGLLVIAATVVFVRRRAARGGAERAEEDPQGSPPPAPVPAAKPAGPSSGSAAPGAVTTAPPAPPPGGSQPRSSERTRLKEAPAPTTVVTPPARRSPAYCWQCGGGLREKARFCGTCGSSVG